MNQLLKVLAAKQRLLGILQNRRTLRSIRFAAKIRSRESGDRPRIDKSVPKWRMCCESLLRAIVEQERESESQMIIRRNETARRLRNIQYAAEIHRAYADDSRTVDRTT